MAEKETVAVQQADAKQSSEEATKKRGLFREEQQRRADPPSHP